QAPAGSSLQYTGAVARQAEKIFAADPDVLSMFSVMGFSFSGAAPNQGIMFVRLKPFDQRRGAGHSAGAIIARLTPKLMSLPSAMQTFLGSSYVNDFQFNNRAYRVYVQADQRFRSTPQDLSQLYARARNGQMVPLASVVTVKETVAPQVIGHFNLFRSATLNGSARPGVSSGDGLREMERIATSTLPSGMSYAWSGISLEETKAGRQSILIFGL